MLRNRLKTKNSIRLNFFFAYFSTLRNSNKINSDFCILATSSADESLCERLAPDGTPLGGSHEDWAGADIIIKHNGNTIATIPTGFREFKHCLHIDDVDVTNDEFQLQSTSWDGICITSLLINRNPILVGENNNLQSFWIDSDQPYCSDEYMSSSQIMIQNGQVISSTCKGQH